MPLLYLHESEWCNFKTALFLAGVSILLPLMTLPSFIWKPERKRQKYFQHKHVLITGGSSGIGKETARRLASYGTRITIVGRNKSRLSSCVAELQAAQTEDHEVVGLQYDVSSEESSEAMMAEAERLQGPVDILINSAGCSVTGYFEEMESSVFRDMMQGNYFAALYSTLAAFKRMKERRRGHIVLTSSLGGLLGVFGFSAYSPAKYAIRGLGEVLWYEGKPFGISISVLYPPDTNTPGFEAEQVGKPEETTKISDTAGFWDPRTVADKLLAGIVRRKLRITMGFDGSALAMVSAGMSPQTSVLEILSMPFLRLASLFYVSQYNRIIAKGHTKRHSKSKRE